VKKVKINKRISIQQISLQAYSCWPVDCRHVYIAQETLYQERRRQMGGRIERQEDR